MKVKRQPVYFSLTPNSRDRLREMAEQKDMPVSVLVRDMLNYALKNGYKT